VPEHDLKGWLADPHFTPYPAIAQALLGLRHRLAAPLFIDVIAVNYESTPNVTSPRLADNVRPDVLKAAIVAAWNVRYGANVQMENFDQLFV
jgi:hypothetical protein